ncbi:MAG TPA: hypothetical protein PKY22_11280 [Accumulibacter sp.]|nr:hypothetical protein [Accumulibacter sp.]
MAKLLVNVRKFDTLKKWIGYRQRADKKLSLLRCVRTSVIAAGESAC